MENNKELFAVSQAHCGHEYCWIFDGPTVEKHIGYLPKEGEFLCEEMFWPMGGSNVSATFVKKLNSWDEAYRFLTIENEGPDSADPMLIELAEYLRTVDVEDGSITQEVLDHFGLKASELTQYDDRYDELLKLGYKPADFYGDESETRYSEAIARKATKIA